MCNNHTLVKYLLTVIFSVIYIYCYSQNNSEDNRPMEIGIDYGPSFLLGDLGGNAGKGSYFLKDINLELSHSSKGLSFTIYPVKWGGLRFGLQHTMLSGDDSKIKTSGSEEVARKRRNLDFRSTIWDAYSAIEIYPMGFFSRESDPTLQPYFFAGVGVFHFDPEGSLMDANGNKSWYKLHPLRTEGQGMTEYPDKKPYKLTQLNLPFGGGLKVKLSPRFYFGLELLYRHTFTDYIDDVSTTYIDPKYFYSYLSANEAAIAAKIHDKAIDPATGLPVTNAPGEKRGSPSQNDDYFSTLLKLGYKFSPQINFDRGTRRSKRSKTSCPVVF